MTWTETSSPTRRAAAAPASVDAFTAPTSPRTSTVTIAGADVFGADQRDVGGLHHGIRGLDRANEALCFNHAESVARSVHLIGLHDILVRNPMQRRDTSDEGCDGLCTGGAGS